MQYLLVAIAVLSVFALVHGYAVKRFQSRSDVRRTTTQERAHDVSSRPLSLGRRSMALPMFGMGGSKSKQQASIKVDGKTIVPSTTPCNLRKELQANNVDVYPLRAKITGNCGGAGICGTCAVRVLEGGENLNPPSKNEQNTLKGKPADFRLSCCARVTGPISIKTKVG